MNEHLRQIFEAIIPAIENADIAYWVYGGIAIAGLNGAYLRENPDVDIFVMSNDYELLMSKIDSGKLLKDRREKLKHDAKVLMSDDEYRALCAHLDRIK